MLKKYFPICLPGLFQSFLTPGPSLSALPNFPKPAYGAAPRDAGLLWLILHKSACTLGTAEPWNRAIPLGVGLNDPYGSLLAQNTLILQFLYILLLLGKKVWQRTARVPSYPHRNTLTIKPVGKKLLRPERCLCTDTWWMGGQVLKVGQSNSNIPSMFILVSSPVLVLYLVFIQYHIYNILLLDDKLLGTINKYLSRRIRQILIPFILKVFPKRYPLEAAIDHQHNLWSNIFIERSVGKQTFIPPNHILCSSQVHRHGKLDSTIIPLACGKFLKSTGFCFHSQEKMTKFTAEEECFKIKSHAWKLNQQS